MKNLNKITFLSIFASLFIIGCTSEKNPNYYTPSKKAEVEIVEKEIILGKNKLVYLSQNLFILDPQMSVQLKSFNPAIINAAYYALNVPNSVGSVGLSYTEYTETPSAESAANGMIDGFMNTPGVTLNDQKKEDISKSIGYPATLRTGKVRLDEPGKEILNGEYYVMAIQKGNEMISFQGIFDVEGTDYGKNLMKLLRSVKLLDNK